LKDEARRHGEVTYTDANRQRNGEGVITFKTAEDMKKAYKSIRSFEIAAWP